MNIIIVYMCQYVYEYSNEYNLSGINTVIVDLFRKIIIPDKKKILSNSKSKIDR